MYFSELIFSDWGANLLVSLCDTRLSCSDMLSSITGSCLSHCLCVYVCLEGFDRVHMRVFVYLIHIVVIKLFRSGYIKCLGMIRRMSSLIWINNLGIFLGALRMFQ